MLDCWTTVSESLIMHGECLRLDMDQGANVGAEWKRSRMREFLTSPAAQVVLSLAMLAMLIAVGFYLVAKVRATVTDEPAGASEMLSKFRDMHVQGELDDQEFRTIRSRLANRLRQELKDTGEEA